VEFSRLPLAARFVVLAALVGCGLDVGGQEALPDGVDTLDGSPVPTDDGAARMDGDGGAELTPDASTDDGGVAADAAAPVDAPAAIGDAQAEATAPFDAAAHRDAGPPGPDAGDPCSALEPCCVIVRPVYGSTGCDMAVKTDDPTTCKALIQSFRSAGLCP
jgi:hypothetical protein